MKRVYTASKMKHARMWLAAHEAERGVFFHARWLKHSALGADDSPENAVAFWQEDIEDVRTADYIMVYAQAEDKLRGALVEAGAAIAFGVPVILVGASDDWGTWQYHPGVVAKFDTVREACAFVRLSTTKQGGE